GASGHYYDEVLYNEPLFITSPLDARVDPQIDLSLGSGASPFAGTASPPFLYNEYFGVRWTGKLKIDTTGDYKFVISSDDGSHFFIDGKLIVEEPGPHGAFDSAPASVHLTAGNHNIVFTMAQGYGGADAHLKWVTPDNPSAAAAPVPADHLLPVQDLPSP